MSDRKATIFAVVTFLAICGVTAGFMFWCESGRSVMNLHFAVFVDDEHVILVRQERRDVEIWRVSLADGRVVERVVESGRDEMTIVGLVGEWLWVQVDGLGLIARSLRDFGERVDHTADIEGDPMLAPGYELRNLSDSRLGLEGRTGKIWELGDDGDLIENPRRHAMSGRADVSPPARPPRVSEPRGGFGRTVDLEEVPLASSSLLLDPRTGAIMTIGDGPDYLVFGEELEGSSVDRPRYAIARVDGVGQAVWIARVRDMIDLAGVSSADTRRTQVRAVHTTGDTIWVVAESLQMGSRRSESNVSTRYVRDIQVRIFALTAETGAVKRVLYPALEP